MKPLNNFILERLTTDKNNIGCKNIIENYNWENDYYGLKGTLEIFDIFYEWLISNSTKLNNRQELIEKSEEKIPLMTITINKSKKEISLFVKTSPIYYSLIYIHTDNIQEKTKFLYYDKKFYQYIQVIYSNNFENKKYNVDTEYYQVNPNLFDDVIKIYFKYRKK